MSLVLVVGLALASILVGSLVLGLADRKGRLARDSPVFALMAGLVTLHLLLQALDVMPIGWSRLSIGIPMVVLGLAAVIWHARRDSHKDLALPAFGWGDGVAALTLLPLALYALQLRIANPDFIYHWGIKAEKFALAGGTDYPFLQRAWNFYVHPDYPNLVPEIFTTMALVQGRWAAGPSLLWSVAVLAMILLGCRHLLGRIGIPPANAQSTLALIALALLSFNVSWQMTGNADGMICLAFVGAALCLVERPSPETDVRVGLTAAFAAASKIEGVAFAAFLTALYLQRCIRVRRWAPGVGLRTMSLPSLVIGAWLAQSWRHGLFQSFYTGDYTFTRLAEALKTMLSISLSDGWHGVSLVCLALLPVLLLHRGSARPVAALSLLQLLFVLYAYATAPGDTELLVRTSFPRLMMHVVPTTLAFAAVALAPRETDEPQERDGSLGSRARQPGVA